MREYKGEGSEGERRGRRKGREGVEGDVPSPRNE
jgi:hypothetical protein